MNLILFDSLTNEEINILKNSKVASGADLFSLESISIHELKNYEKVVVYVGLTLNFLSNNFVNFVAEFVKSQEKNLQIGVVFVEKFDQNAKIAIDWLNMTNQTYMSNFKVIAEISRENFSDELNFTESVKDNAVTIYTDGACSGNPGAGGWGAILMTNSKAKEISGFEAETTNNKMELTAVIKALELLKKPCTVDLYSDSAYVVNAINLGWLENWKANGWKGADKKSVKNIELWQALDNLLAIHKVTFIKVKGHADNKFNNRCDELATGEIAKHANQI